MVARPFGLARDRRPCLTDALIDIRGRIIAVTRPTLAAAALAALALSGCDSTPKHDPADPFYVGHVARNVGPAADPSVGTGRSPTDAPPTGGAGPYMSGGAGPN